MLDESARDWLHSEVKRVAELNLPEGERALFTAFSEHFIHIHVAESLLAWRVQDLFAALRGLLAFSLQRDGNAPKLKVFNPSEGTDGWSAPHTVIYICQRDMPFLVDSLRMALNRLGLSIYLFESQPAWVARGDSGSLVGIQSEVPASNKAAYQREDFAFLQIDYQGEQSERDLICEALASVLNDVSLCVDDYQAMLKRLDSTIDQLRAAPDVDNEDIDFLRWLRQGNFTLLGMTEFERKEAVIQDEAGEQVLVSTAELTGQQLGLMRLRDPLPETKLSELSHGFGDFQNSAANLAFTKSSHKSTVHRAVYSDYVFVKLRDAQGRVRGELRLLGLYTSQLYHRSIWNIPLIRKKAEWLLEHSRLDANSHDGKAYIALLEAHPRDELIQTEREQLLDISLGIWRIYDRRAVRLFMRVDAFEKFASCIVYLPRESLSTETRERIANKLKDALDADVSEFTTQFLSESVLARIHFVFRIRNQKYQTIDRVVLEQQIVDLTRDWCSDLRERIGQRYGNKRGPALMRQWANAFQPAYQHQFSLEECLEDLQCVVDAQGSEELGVRFFNETGSSPDIMRLKLFRREASLELSDMIPMLENLGFRVLVEHPHQIIPRQGKTIWMHDFTLRFTMNIQGSLDVAATREHFREALIAVWQGRAANDGFNRLVLGARLDWRSAALLRACAHYLKQLGTSFSPTFIADVLAKHLDISRNLLALFKFRFDPRLYSGEDAASQRQERVQRLSEKIIADLDSVQNRNEDELVRCYLTLFQACQRTNFFKAEVLPQDEFSIALKFALSDVEFAPRPRPLYEIYVYSPRMEGVHLRGGKVARGGIRWSDRPEDFRTEVLGLVKAQQVKNAVIVPTGAKGGFISRWAGAKPNRDEWLAEGIACYRLFISALLEITDNRIDEKIVPPLDVVRIDSDDPYLVVAADKGTASFSDIANELSAQYGHWLGDAFASGGSNGYDHKGMGITARGAWVAVQRHFRELGIDVQKDSVDVIGIGDMSGDVFGNGLLLSRTLRLKAAFNHLHIFIDPNPDPEQSFQERERLFTLPRSGWADYDQRLISSGGGVFERSAKRIPLSEEMKTLLACTEDSLAPDELIRQLLRTPIDLIWNGGVGTYVKASNESDLQVGDRANDTLRVMGSELRCKVFGEGGNLGLTQLGRIEFCRHGGVCNTDFIDNAAGVDCSDHEVNIKILLDDMVGAGRLAQDQRNDLLKEMTDDVAELVLMSNYRQTQALSIASHSRATQHYNFLRFLQYLESIGILDRKLEFLAEDDDIKERFSKSEAWTRPELSVLLSYSKVLLKDQLLSDRLPEDRYLLRYLESAFPDKLRQLTGDSLYSHQLAPQIIATKLANDMVNKLGFTHCYRLCDALGVSAKEVSHAFIVVMNLFGLEELWESVEALDLQVPSELQYELLERIMGLGRRASRWYLRNRKSAMPAEEISRAEICFSTLKAHALNLHQPGWRELAEERANGLESAGLPSPLAEQCAVIDSYFFFPGMIEISLKTSVDVVEVTELGFALAALLRLDELLASLLDWQSKNRWQDMASESNVDELESLICELTEIVLLESPVDDSSKLDNWQQSRKHDIDRFQRLMLGANSGPSDDLSMITVILRELRSLNASSRGQLCL